MNEEWRMENNISTMKQLWGKLQLREYLKKLSNYNTIILALGTNELANQSISGFDVFDMLVKITKHITKHAKVNMELCQPPPKHINLMAFVTFNSLLRNLEEEKGIHVIQVDSYFNLTLKSETIEEKCCILTDVGTEIYAKAIQEQQEVPEKAWADMINSDEESDETDNTEESD